MLGDHGLEVLGGGGLPSVGGDPVVEDGKKRVVTLGNDLQNDPQHVEDVGTLVVGQREIGSGRFADAGAEAVADGPTRSTARLLSRVWPGRKKRLKADPSEPVSSSQLTSSASWKSFLPFLSDACM